MFLGGSVECGITWTDYSVLTEESVRCRSLTLAAVKRLSIFL